MSITSKSNGRPNAEWGAEMLFGLSFGDLKAETFKMRLVRSPTELDAFSENISKILVASFEGEKVYCALVCPDASWRPPPTDTESSWSLWEGPQDLIYFLNPSKLFTTHRSRTDCDRVYRTYHSTEFPVAKVWEHLTPEIVLALGKDWVKNSEKHFQEMAENLLAEAEDRWGPNCGVTRSTQLFPDRFHREPLL